MGLIGELFRAMFLGATPIAVTSFLLTWWALRHDYFGQIASLKEMERKVKLHSKAVKQQKRDQKSKNKNRTSAPNATAEAFDENPVQNSTTVRKLNPLHSKWLAFGGGFYGVVGLFTYAVVELVEVRDFFANFEGILHFLDEISIGLLINLLVDSIKNFVAAIAWPYYWMTYIRSQHIWLWFIAAYAGYWLGTRYAIQRYSRNGGRV